MPVRVQCPNPECHASFSIAPGEEARFRRCPQCGTELSGIGPGEAPETASNVSAQEWPSGLIEGMTFAGRYKIVSVLGRGGMGMVYLARDAELDRDVALKVPLFDPDPNARRRFRREAKSAAKLHHANICPIFDVGEHGDQSYLTMAFIEGTSLADYVKGRSAPLDPNKAARLVRSVARALQVAHEAGVVHRDLKPANIMMDREGRPVVMDFGLARLHDPADSLRTKSGQMMGTPAYMPLEQFQGDLQAIGPASDVYSLGVILFQLLTGRLPFEGNAFVIFKELQANGPPSASTFRPGLDPRLEAICRKAMARESVDRYGSMKEFAEALDVVLGRSVAAPKAGPSAPDAARPVVGPAVPADSRVVGDSRVVKKTAGTAGPTGRRLGLALAGVVLAAVLGVVIYVVTDKGTVKITGTDPAMTVQVDGDTIEITRLGEPITLKAGAHHLLVTRGGLVVKAEAFQVMRGGEKVLEVEDTPPKPTETAKAQPDPEKVKPTETDHTKMASAPPPAPADPPPAEPKDEAPAPPPKPPAVLTNSVGMTMKLIPAGTFEMGSPDSDTEADADEKPQNVVEIIRAFYLAAHEVTQEQYAVVVGGDPPSRAKGHPKNPVEQVSWFEAVSFCNRLSAKEGLRPYYQVTGVSVTTLGGDGYRLPTEAEWEYACRAGGKGKYGHGDDESKLDQFAWFGEEFGEAYDERKPHPVGQKTPNDFGLYDMHGNVREWCWDWYDEKQYQNMLITNPDGPKTGIFRALRGGSFDGSASFLRAAYRVGNLPANRPRDSGFRLARTYD